MLEHVLDWPPMKAKSSEELSHESKVAAAQALGRTANQLVEDGIDTPMEGSSTLFRLLETNASVEEIDAFLSMTTGDLRDCCLSDLTYMETEVQPPGYMVYCCGLPAINAGKRWREARPEVVAEAIRANDAR